MSDSQDKFTQMKNLIHEELGDFYGVIQNENLTRIEKIERIGNEKLNRVVNLLQDRFDVNEWVADQYLEAFISGKLI